MNMFKKIMSFIIIVIAIVIAGLSNVKHAYADETLLWQRTPLNVILPVGKERFITFPEAVQFGYDSNTLPDSVLRVQNDNHTLYLLAKQPFATQRVEAKLESGEIVLLDLSAAENAHDAPITVNIPIAQAASTATNVTNANTISTQSPSSDTSVDYVSLTRYAIQQLYAPERLLVPSMAITRFPMETTHVAPLFYDGSASAMPLASWYGNHLYVTAVFIKNLLNQPLRLDPRTLCGSWMTASFYPQTTLAPHGSAMDKDASTLFVISSQPFSEAIQSCKN